MTEHKTIEDIKKELLDAGCFTYDLVPNEQVVISQHFAIKKIDEAAQLVAEIAADAIEFASLRTGYLPAPACREVDALAKRLKEATGGFASPGKHASTEARKAMEVES